MSKTKQAKPAQPEYNMHFVRPREGGKWFDIFGFCVTRGALDSRGNWNPKLYGFNCGGVQFGLSEHLGEVATYLNPSTDTEVVDLLPTPYRFTWDVKERILRKHGVRL